MNTHLRLVMALFVGICFVTTSFAGDWFSEDIINFVREPTATVDLQNPDSKLAVPKAARTTVGLVPATSPFANDWVPADLIRIIIAESLPPARVQSASH
jgi:hypothetical protein